MKKQILLTTVPFGYREILLKASKKILFCSTFCLFFLLSIVNHLNAQNCSSGTQKMCTATTSTPTIVMVTHRGVGGKISLLIKATDKVVAEGITEPIALNELKEYTLTSQTIKLLGPINEITCGDNELTSLDLSGCPSLGRVYCYNNLLTSLDVSNNQLLTSINCSDNKLKHIELDKNVKLRGLACMGNELTELNLTNNTELTFLYCYNNPLKNLNVSHNVKLGKLLCNNTSIIALNISALTQLQVLYCQNNHLQNLDISHNPKLNYIYCFGNALKEVAMDNIVNTLADCSSQPQPSEFVVINSKGEKEENVITKDQVNRAKTKNWRVLDYNGDGDKMINYEGSNHSAIDGIFRGSTKFGAFCSKADNTITFYGALPYSVCYLYQLDGTVVANVQANNDGEGCYTFPQIAEGTYILGTDYGVSVKISL